MNNLVFEVGYTQHQERVARGEAQAQFLMDAPPRRPLRITVASLLIGLAHRLAPSLDRYPPAAAARA